MVDALVSGASAARRASSSLVPGTEKRFNFMVTTPKLNRFFSYITLFRHPANRPSAHFFIEDFINVGRAFDIHVSILIA